MEVPDELAEHLIRAGAVQPYVLAGTQTLPSQTPVTERKPRKLSAGSKKKTTK